MEKGEKLDSYELSEEGNKYEDLTLTPQEIKDFEVVDCEAIHRDDRGIHISSSYESGQELIVNGIEISAGNNPISLRTKNFKICTEPGDDKDKNTENQSSIGINIGGKFDPLRLGGRKFHLPSCESNIFNTDNGYYVYRGSKVYFTKDIPSKIEGPVKFELIGEADDEGRFRN